MIKLPEEIKLSWNNFVWLIRENILGWSVLNLMFWTMNLSLQLPEQFLKLHSILDIILSSYIVFAWILSTVVKTGVVTLWIIQWLGNCWYRWYRSDGAMQWLWINLIFIDLLMTGLVMVAILTRTGLDTALGLGVAALWQDYTELCSRENINWKWVDTRC